MNSVRLEHIKHLEMMQQLLEKEILSQNNNSKEWNILLSSLTKITNESNVPSMRDSHKLIKMFSPSKSNLSSHQS